MQGFKKCTSGHFYKEHLGECPYCKDKGPISDSTQVTEKIDNFKGTDTVGTSSDGDRTQVFGGPSGLSNLPGRDTVKITESTSNFDSNDRTFIGGIGDSPQLGDTHGLKKEGDAVVPRSSRKIVGWLISYTIDPMGADYHIYEGNNPIGRDTSNSIILIKDSTISSKHLNILFRHGKYYARDEMSANGSWINNEPMEIGHPYVLNDGDLLKVGNTVFKFKSSL